MLDFIAKYYQLISVIFGLLAAGFTIVRVVSFFTGLYGKLDQRVRILEVNDHALNHPDGRVNKLSSLVEREINTNLEAAVKAEGAQKTANTILALVTKIKSR